MTSSEKPCSGTQFVRTGVVADADGAASVRREFSDWLRRSFTLDTTKASDVVLAVNEAMANAAEFAYVTAGSVGRNPDEVLRVLDALQTDELCACNWKSGDETLKVA